MLHKIKAPSDPFPRHDDIWHLQYLGVTQKMNICYGLPQFIVAYSW